MRPTVKLTAHLSIEQIRERLSHRKNARHASYWQILLSASLNPDKPAKEYCSQLGISDTKFYRVVAAYNQKGAGFCRDLSWTGEERSAAG